MTRTVSGPRQTAAAMWWFVSALTAPAAAIADEIEFMPPYVPTVQDDVDLMLEIGDVGPGDYVVDLGSGDGRIVISAARRGADGHGVEIDPELVEEATRRAEAAGVADRAAFVEGDIFDADISQASVVTLYLYPEVNLALRPRLLSELRPGARVLSNSFDMGDWQPDVHDKTARSSGGILMWVVPADVAGDWQLEVGEDETFALNATQRFQKVSLRLAGDDGMLAVRSARLRGDRLEFVATAGGTRYLFNGRVDDDGIDGMVQVRDGGTVRVHSWHARRAASADARGAR
ncbi:MAG: class I SAM-dependent methyltransferase [Gammaproteobacteria bacterium]|nr:class I SAM-dependent methyltransferase [Gammaproteobacteria bacterium]